ncbi:Choline-sulfatase [hydrothermal vent metagenome]|uniref:Choline-sulfatase n=1 Tax=hydrothermal vent metagenome TaxID=652676 RepID=A0A3B0SIZ0_9ZZZZ
MVMQKPSNNVLFLSIEDLNDWVEPLGGHPDTKTPNINRLAHRGMVFDAAFAAAPACSPSRTSALFGQNPWETGIYANNHQWHQFYKSGARKSLVGRFRDAGYQTRGAGKVFHVSPDKFDFDDWTEFEQRHHETYNQISKTAQTSKIGNNTDFGPTEDEQQQYDDYNTDWVINQMKAEASGQFWALGLYRPHLPFIVPKRFFDLFPSDIANPPGLGMNRFDAYNMATQKSLPDAGRKVADKSGFLRRTLHKCNEYKIFTHAYLASIAYADDLLGKVLDHMDATKLWENTTVVLWSDHGWQFGEKLAFRKFSLWERALRVPLIFAGPGINIGHSDEPVSLIDIAPTLFSLMGLTCPDQFSGQDLSPVLCGKEARMRGHTLSIWGANFTTDSPYIALTNRSKTHRYIFYWDGSEELYDHRVDPYEHNNLIFTPGDVPKDEINRLREEHQRALEFDLADPVS